VFFHTAVAEKLGIGATEEKTLLMLSAGPLTAGEIAQQTGLTTASVTSLIDRLESKGFVNRVRDANDRRRVIVEPNAEKLAELARVFGSMQGMFDDLGTFYTDDQLATIIDFLKRMSASAKEAIKQLGQKSL
jgi:DNA-binding MarR family transcriptional regulator